MSTNVAELPRFNLEPLFPPEEGTRAGLVRHYINVARGESIDPRRPEIGMVVLGGIDEGVRQGTYKGVLIEHPELLNEATRKSVGRNLRYQFSKKVAIPWAFSDDEVSDVILTWTKRTRFTICARCEGNGEVTTLGVAAGADGADDIVSWTIPCPACVKTDEADS